MKARSLLVGLAAVAPLTLVMFGCAASNSAGSGASTTPAASSKSLYDRLGGKDALVAVVNDFTNRVAADQRINARFANTDIPHFKMELTDQLCEATGGPCKYTGKDMKTAHAGQGVTNEEFDALVADLVATLNQFKVGAEEQKQLLGALSPMRPQIVGQ